MVVATVVGSPIGERVRRRREELGLLQKELAGQARVPHTWLSNLELGKVGVQLRVDRLLRVARALGMSLEQLIEGETGRVVHKELTPEEDRLIETVRGFTGVSMRRVRNAIVGMYRADDELFYDYDGSKEADRLRERARPEQRIADQQEGYNER